VRQVMIGVSVMGLVMGLAAGSAVAQVKTTGGLMASPLAKGLFHKAIGESGAFLSAGGGTLSLAPLGEAEKVGARFAASAGAESIAALRAKPAQEVLDAAQKTKQFFAPIIDGDFLPSDACAIYAAGRQSQVPLLAGWNADEMRSAVTLRPQKPTIQSFADDARKRFGSHADAILKAYPAASDAEALESAAALGSDMFIGYSTWKWIEMHGAPAKVPVYRYSFDRKIPVPPGNTVMGVAATSAEIGARHAGEIEYVFGALDISLPKVPWEPADRTLSDAMTTYWANFARTGDLNGAGLPTWPLYHAGGRRVLHLDVTIRDTEDVMRPRYEAIDAFVTAQRGR
jgi:para-nitrobenzyl esterase